MILGEIKLKLQSKLNYKRFKHSVNVMDEAIKLASIFGEDTKKAATAGLLHDCARDIKGDELFETCHNFNVRVDEVTRIQPELLHGPLGAHIARTEYKVSDDSVLKAIHWHTTGHAGMSVLDKIVFLADYIEPGRRFPGIEDVRRAAANDLDAAMMLALDRTIKYVVSRGTLLHPDTVDARNSILIGRNMAK
jgi:predicted HD superfamily hydrolase involved in NAD metabolism